MTRIKENKTRKRLRIALCIFYLFEIALCTLPYFQFIDEKNILHTYSVLDLMSVWGSTIPNSADGRAAITYTVFVPILLIIPIAGFFFCALDKERNLKNIASLVCCLLGVLSILLIVSYTISLGSMLALLLYLLICFITTISIFARFAKEPDKKSEENNFKK